MTDSRFRAGFRPGVSARGTGYDFSLYSEVAKSVELCLLSDSFEIVSRTPLQSLGEGRWSVFMPGVSVGQKYAYRVDGPFAPELGCFCEKSTLLLDPYARGVQASGTDTALRYATRVAEICDTEFDWKGSHPPHIPWEKLVIYEAHVKGMTQLHPEVPEALRGTYLGLCSEPILRHLERLGVRAIELLPIHLSLSESHLLEKGLSNYWGYNTLGFFCPDPRYATLAAKHSPQKVLREFQEMVRTFHTAGIEVILDVVYNHTAEGNMLGQTLSFRGIDNGVYYRGARDPLTGNYRYEDYSGCGNTLNLSHPMVLRMVLDSLRYWAEEVHIDGFRIDLASALCRDSVGRYQKESPFMYAILQDEILSTRKIIVEPWDATPEGYQTGNFPKGSSEWNDTYRDTVRRFWRGDAGMVPPFASVISGSSHLYSHGHRSPRASVNFVTAHDGFSLRDLVSYAGRHNTANGEEGRDGTSENFSASYGPAGVSVDADQEELRKRQMKNFICTLFLSLGVPMILGGDELTRTQSGNNNAYCQDNEVSWLDWSKADEYLEFQELIAYLGQLRKQLGTFALENFLNGAVSPKSGKRDVVWLKENGTELLGEEWNNSSLSSLQIYFSDAFAPFSSESLLLFCNPSNEPRSFRISEHLLENAWRLFLRTDERTPFAKPITLRAGHSIEVAAHTMMVFRG